MTDDIIKSDMLSAYQRELPPWIMRYAGTPFYKEALALELESMQAVSEIRDRQRLCSLKRDAGQAGPDAATEQQVLYLEERACELEYASAKEKLAIRYVEWLRSGAVADEAVRARDIEKGAKEIMKGGCSVEKEKGDLNKAANPWAVCHASTGPGKTEKFESCVQDVKKKEGIEKALGDEKPADPKKPTEKNVHAIVTPLSITTRDLTQAQQKGLAIVEAQRNTELARASIRTAKQPTTKQYGEFVTDYNFGPGKR